MNLLLSRSRLLGQVLIGIFRLDRAGFLLTTFFCASWRILIIAAYAFALKTLIDVYQTSISTGSDGSWPVFSLLMVFLFFTLTGCFDIVYTNLREKLNGRILEVFERSSNSENKNRLGRPYGTDNSHAMLVSKSFDAMLGLLLFVIGLAVIGIISRSIFLIFIAMLPIFAILYYVVKRYFSFSVSDALTTNNRVNYQNLRQLRASIYRFVSQISAGMFVVALCLFLLNTESLSFSVLQVAILGFSVRFSISFLSLFLLNTVSLLDRIDILRYFNRVCRTG